MVPRLSDRAATLSDKKLMELMSCDARDVDTSIDLNELALS